MAQEVEPGCGGNTALSEPDTPTLQCNIELEWGGSPASYIPAPESFTTVAAFRPWRDLQTIVAGEPAGPPLTDGIAADRYTESFTL